MKKLFTLFLVLAGCVGTASALSIYVQNTRAWGSIWLHEWNGESDAAAAWPGVQQCVSEIVDNNWYFKITINRENFILNNGGNGIETQTLKASDFEDGAYYWVWEDNKGLTKMDEPAYSYCYNLVVEGNDINNIYTYQGENRLTGNWPGAYVIAKDGKYTLTYKSSSITGTINVIFNKGDNAPQTGDLWANEGDNTYYIASMASSSSNGSWGEGIKTNAYGLATYVSYNSLTIPSGLTYYAEDTNDGSADAKDLTNPAASTPMLVKGAANTIYHFATAASGTDYSSSNAFKAGNGGKVYGGNGSFNYVLNGDAFYLAKSEANGGTTVANNKAYLQLSHQAAAGARVLRFADDETQGINVVVAAEANDDACYNLGGQRVNTPAKGLYIRNGKKFIYK